MSQKSLWLVELIITIIVLLAAGSIIVPQAGRAETEGETASAVAAPK